MSPQLNVLLDEFGWSWYCTFAIAMRRGIAHARAYRLALATLTLAPGRSRFLRVYEYTVYLIATIQVLWIPVESLELILLVNRGLPGPPTRALYVYDCLEPKVESSIV